MFYLFFPSGQYRLCFPFVILYMLEFIRRYFYNSNKNFCVVYLKDLFPGLVTSSLWLSWGFAPCPLHSTTKENGLAFIWVMLNYPGKLKIKKGKENKKNHGGCHSGHSLFKDAGLQVIYIISTFSSLPRICHKVPRTYKGSKKCIHAMCFKESKIEYSVK